MRAHRLILAGLLIGMAWLSPGLERPGLVSGSRAEAQQSQQRVALVIGNKDYHSAPLSNSLNDAEDMAQRLRTLGFEVMLERNLADEKAMKKAVRAAAAQIQPGGVFLFYYSGHGLQLRGLNYLIPVGAELQKEADAEYEALPLNLVLDELAAAGAGINIVVLDACRNNPFVSSLKSGDRGLAGITRSPTGTFIAFATAPGETASDNPGGRNGLFTQELLRSLEQPGKVEDVFKRVAREVRSKSGQQQQPWINSSLTEDFFFGGQDLPAAAPATLAPELPAPQTPECLVCPKHIIHMQTLLLRLRLPAVGAGRAQVVVDWGDGTPPSQSAYAQAGGEIEVSHRFARLQLGSSLYYHITVFARNEAGKRSPGQIEYILEVNKVARN